MRFRLVPSNDVFFERFADAGRNMAEAIAHLRDFVHDYRDLEAKHALVKEHEHRGDDITRDVLSRLVATFVTPFDREDIHALAEAVDNVVDGVYHVSEMLVLMPIEAMLPELLEQADVLAEMSTHAVAVLDRLAAFKGLTGDLIAIDALESKGDTIYRRTVARLFSGEFSALDVLKWKDIVDSLEDTMDKLEDVADVVASIVVKHA